MRAKPSSTSVSRAPWRQAHPSDDLFRSQLGTDLKRYKKSDVVNSLALFSCFSVCLCLSFGHSPSRPSITAMRLWFWTIKMKLSHFQREKSRKVLKRRKFVKFAKICPIRTWQRMILLMIQLARIMMNRMWIRGARGFTVQILTFEKNAVSFCWFYGCGYKLPRPSWLGNYSWEIIVFSRGILTMDRILSRI